MMKTVLAPRSRRACSDSRSGTPRIFCWQPGREVLDDPESFKTKEESKLGVLEYILQPDQLSRAVRQRVPQVRINYYPPRATTGRLGHIGHLRMARLSDADQGRLPVPRSISAAPIVLDLALFFDLAQRARHSGSRNGCRSTSRAPDGPGLYPEHDLFIQQTKLKNTLRWLLGEEQITHLGMSTTRRRERLAVRRHGRRARRMVWVMWYFLLSRGRQRGRRPSPGRAGGAGGP